MSNRAQELLGTRLGFPGGAPQMRWLPLVLLPLVTGLSLCHYTGSWRTRRERAAEERQCVQRLREFYQAFQAYRRDHGEYPPTPAKLFPHYIHSMDAFVCPAYQPARFTAPVAQRVKVGTRTILNTYYFPYKALQDPAVHIRPERVPLMVCSVHAELVHEDSYRRYVNRRDAVQKQRFIRRYGVPALLVLRRDGRIQRCNELDEPATGIRYLEFEPDGTPVADGGVPTGLERFLSGSVSSTPIMRKTETRRPSSTPLGSAAREAGGVRE